MSKNTSSQAVKGDIPACFTDTHGIMTSTMNDLPGYKVTRNLGVVYGLTVRSRNWGADIGGLLKSAVGGELPMFTNMVYKARHEALERLVGECMGRGGNAIIALRFDVSAMSEFTQVCAYGTACIVEEVKE